MGALRDVRSTVLTVASAVVGACVRTDPYPKSKPNLFGSEGSEHRVGIILGRAPLDTFFPKHDEEGVFKLVPNE